MTQQKNFSASPEILEAVKKAIPTGPDDFGRIGNEPVFRLCQYLKGIVPENTTSDAIHAVVLQWWECSKNILIMNGIEDFTTVWIQFTDLWDTPGKVKFPKRDSLQTAIARAKVRTADRPELVPLPDDKLKLLGHVCYELQQLSGDNPFFLSGKNAGAVMGKCEKTGGLALKYFLRQKIIELVKPGHTGKSTEYRYIGLYRNDQERRRAEQVHKLRETGDL